MEKEIKEFAECLREPHAKVQRANWEKHNQARSAAHADYNNPHYVRNRLIADKAWQKDSDDIVDLFKKVSDLIISVDIS